LFTSFRANGIENPLKTLVIRWFTDEFDDEAVTRLAAEGVI